MPRRAALNVAINFVVIVNVANMSVTTKRGDDGKSRWMGRVVDKDGPLLEAIGDLDELMAAVGIVGEEVSGIKKITEKTNKELYYLSGYLAGYNKKIDLSESIKFLEQDIEKMESEMEKLHNFLLPGSGLNVWLNWSRTVCRRTERSLVTLAKTQPVEKTVLIFINRLSDYLFMLGRSIK